ncbi:MAG: insulinase family protein [Lewinellaceae bacterium]|nr:insulinase family protein [Lewinellaceae bacterium]
MTNRLTFWAHRCFLVANGVNGGCLSKHSDRLLEIMSDVLLNPVFPQEELDKSKKRAESGLASQKDDANAIAGIVASVLRYGKDHPYGENMTEATLAKINLEQIKNHYNIYFKPNISYLVVTGDVTKARLKSKPNSIFGKWGKGWFPHTITEFRVLQRKHRLIFPQTRRGAIGYQYHLSC